MTHTKAKKKRIGTGAGEEIRARAQLTSELWQFLKVRRKWWLAPVLVMILLVGGLILLAQLTPLGPLVYTLF
jgi:hypothetical protein